MQSRVLAAKSSSPETLLRRSLPPPSSMPQVHKPPNKTSWGGGGFDFSQVPVLPLRSRPLPYPIQAKLEIGAVNDPLEDEAERTAEHVMRMPDPAASLRKSEDKLLRKCASCEEEDKEHAKVARRVSCDGSSLDGLEAPEAVHQVLRSPGRPLDSPARAFFEPRFGTDLSRVRVHTDDKAAESAHSLGAMAYTVGRDIVFGRNQYSHHSGAGRHLLAHELAHTLQQGAAATSSLSSTSVPASTQRIQRQPESAAVHSSPPPAVPFEKWSPDVESMYRRNGLVVAANAVAKCREGDCSKVLTEAEAYQAYRNGRVSAGLGAPPENESKIPKGAALVGAAALPLAAPAGDAAAGAAAKTALEKAALRWGTAEVVQGGAAAAPGAAAVATVAVPVALGIYLIVATVDLVGYGKFQVALQKQGYVILPHPLQVCISGCHQPAAPTFGPDNKFAPKTPFPGFGKVDEDAIREWLEPTPTQGGKKRQPTPAPAPQAVPAPQIATQPKSSKCTDTEVDKLHDAMKKICDNIQGCSMQGDTCATATAKVAAFYACIDARENIQKKCFSKGDAGYEGHMQQISQLYAAMRKCQGVMMEKCK